MIAPNPANQETTEQRSKAETKGNCQNPSKQISEPADLAAGEIEAGCNNR
jgi:hypothetical protein